MFKGFEVLQPHPSYRHPLTLDDMYGIWKCFFFSFSRKKIFFTKLLSSLSQIQHEPNV